MNPQEILIELYNLNKNIKLKKNITPLEKLYEYTHIFENLLQMEIITPFQALNENHKPQLSTLSGSYVDDFSHLTEDKVEKRMMKDISVKIMAKFIRFLKFSIYT